MNNVVLSTQNIDDLINDIANEVVKKIRLLDAKNTQPDDTSPDDPLFDMIEKKNVAGKLASASTLWKWEKAGKIQAYGIGGKRFYKRSELMEAFTRMNKKGLNNGK